MVENLLKVSSFQKKQDCKNYAISRYVSIYSVTDLKVKKPTVIQPCRHRGAGTGGATATKILVTSIFDQLKK